MLSQFQHTLHESDGYSEVTFDLALLANDGHLVYQRQRNEQVAQIDERPGGGGGGGGGNIIKVALYEIS